MEHGKGNWNIRLEGNDLPPFLSWPIGSGRMMQKK
jgi:hypothetical protein